MIISRQGPGGKFINFFSKESHIVKIESFNPLFSLYMAKSCYKTNTMPKIVPCLFASAIKFGSCPKPKLQQPIRIKPQKHLNFVSLSESSIPSPENTRELPAPLGSPLLILIHEVFRFPCLPHLFSSHSNY